MKKSGIFLIALLFLLPLLSAYQCSDGIDNDGDGCIDYPADIYDCTSRYDDSESGSDCTSFYQDPNLWRQWYFHNLGQNGLIDADIDAYEAWGIEEGSNEVLIAIMSTGVDLSHLDLQDNLWTNNDPLDGIDNDGNGYVDDLHGWDFVDDDNWPVDPHGLGTQVAGIVAATSNNIVNNPQGPGEADNAILTSGNYQGVAKIDFYSNSLVLTNSDDATISVKNLFSPYGSTTLFTAPTQSPTGISYKDGNYWISDPQMDNIYEVEQTLPAATLTALRLIVTDSYDLDGYEQLRLAEVEMYYQDSVNIAPQSIVSVTCPLADCTGEYIHHYTNTNDNDIETYYLEYDADPVTLIYTFSQAVTIDKILIRSSNFPPTDFSLDYYDGTSWNNIGSYTGNSESTTTHTIGPFIYGIGTSYTAPGNEVRGIDWQTPYWWVADEEQRAIYKLSETGTVLNRYQLPCKPWGVSSNGIELAVSCTDTLTTLILDATTGTITDSFDTTLIKYKNSNSVYSQPRGIDWNPELGQFYLIDNGHELQNNVDTHSYIFLTDNTIDSYTQEGVAGTCWNCKYLPLRVLEHEYGMDESKVLEAFNYAVDNGADIILTTWTDYGNPSILKYALDSLPDEVIVIAPAGNIGNNVRIPYPARHPKVLAVGGSSNYDENYYQSNYNAPDNKWIDLAAPAYALQTTTFHNSYSSFSGTSLAAGLVAGTTGLIISHHPTYPPAQVVTTLLSSTDPLQYTYQDYGPETDNALALGMGRLNSYRALTENEKNNNLIIESYRIDDAVGNGDGLLQAGETARLAVTFKNNGQAINEISASLQTTSPGVSILRNNLQLGNIGRLERKTDTFSLAINPSVTQDFIDFTIRIRPMNKPTFSLPLRLRLPEPQQKGFPLKPEEQQSFFWVIPADINGDGDGELLTYSKVNNYQSPQEQYLSLYTNDAQVLFTKETERLLREPLLADLDGDGKLEVITLTSTRTLQVIDDNGEDLWERIVLEPIFSGPTIEDIDGDGDYEIVLLVFIEENEEFSLRAWHHEGTSIQIIENVHIPDYYGTFSPLLLVDVNHDDAAEIFLYSSSTTIYGFDGNGNTLLGFPKILGGWSEDPDTRLVSADIDDDGETEIIVPAGRTLHVLTGQGNLKWSAELSPSSTVVTSKPIIANIEGSQEKEIIIYTDDYMLGARLQVFDSAGNSIPCWSNIPIDYTIPQILALNSDTDNYQEIFIVGKNIIAYNADCTESSHMPYEGIANSKASLYDLDRDGDFEFIVPKDILSVIDTNFPGPSSWPMNAHNSLASNNVDWQNTVQKCSDYVSYGICSSQQPFYCNQGVIEQNCQLCGCPDNAQICTSSGNCVSKVLKDPLYREELLK